MDNHFLTASISSVSVGVFGARKVVNRPAIKAFEMALMSPWFLRDVIAISCRSAGVTKSALDWNYLGIKHRNVREMTASGIETHSSDRQKCK
jgi:hypothetical protein